MILYAGNILSKHGNTPTFIETLAPKIARHYKIKSVSDKKEQLFRLWDMVISLLKNKKDIELVLIDSYSMKAFWYTYILARLCNQSNISYIPILRGGSYPYRFKKSPVLCKFIFSHSAKNISPSIYLKKYFNGEGYEVEYIPNFIPIRNYDFFQRTSVRPKLLWVRSFDITYNPLLAIEILDKLKNKYPDAVLCMVGPDKDGTLQKIIDKASELNVSDSLKLTGKLSKKEWLALSKEYDIFINTTDFDNHPVSVIEAMALGLPVITTNVGGLPYLIEDRIDGILVPPGNADKFVEEIDNLISDNELVFKITTNARKKAEEFDWEFIKNKWFTIFDTIVTDSSKREN
ncbi:MAG: glycosyltransferase family 4 protein [Bacteroidota bacterium]|nr:glycosyltransferase family 4 protein [Bacteroidota bacterium]